MADKNIYTVVVADDEDELREAGAYALVRSPDALPTLLSEA